jgi:hypothetical protein
MKFSNYSIKKNLSQQFQQSADFWDLEQLYLDLTLAKRQHRASQTQQLTSTEKAYLRGLLCGYSPPEIAAEMNREPGGLRVDLSRGLYRYIEILTQQHPKDWKEIPILLIAYQKERPIKIQPSQNFQKTSGSLQSLQNSSFKYSNSQELEEKLIDVSMFVGRENELATLNQWILQDRCRLVAILGLTGMGKTFLAAKLADHLKNEFEAVIWRSLDHPLPLSNLLIDLLEVLSKKHSFSFDQFCLRQFSHSFIHASQPHQLMPHFLTESEVILSHFWKDAIIGLISEFIKLLKTHRCLIIFDRWEAIFSPNTVTGTYLAGYEVYGEFLKKVSTLPHQSCVLLTSSEKPKEVAELEGEILPIRSLKLSGLGEAAGDLLKRKGLTEQVHWKTFIQAYDGNPLALKILATTIQDIFAGKVGNFLPYSSYLGDFREHLFQQFSRLSNLEKQLISILHQNHQPISLEMLASSLHQEFSDSDCLTGLESLLRRSLLETIQQDSQTLFFLPLLVRKYLTHPWTPT